MSMPPLQPPYRISIVGCSGAGKTTLARALAERLAIPHVELDALYHQEGWKPQEREELRRQTLAATPPDGQWVVCGNYEDTVGTELRARANQIVFLDLPRGLVMRRIISRSAKRVVSREELWNGNRERWLNLLHPNPKHNIVLWAFTLWGPYRRRYRHALHSGAWHHAAVYHFTRPEQVTRWLGTLEAVQRPIS